MSCGSAGSWPASDADDDYISCSTDDSGFWSLCFCLCPAHEPLVGSLWVPLWGLFLYVRMYICMYVVYIMICTTLDSTVCDAPKGQTCGWSMLLGRVGSSIFTKVLGTQFTIIAMKGVVLSRVVWMGVMCWFGDVVEEWRSVLYFSPSIYAQGESHDVSWCVETVTVIIIVEEWHQDHLFINACIATNALRSVVRHIAVHRMQQLSEQWVIIYIRQTALLTVTLWCERPWGLWRPQGEHNIASRCLVCLMGVNGWLWLVECQDFHMYSVCM